MLSVSDNAMYMLAGPTAVGKSSVGHFLARRHGGSILSVDSMQVYRGMDLGTAKVSAQEQGEVVYGGMDLLGVDEAFDLSKFLAFAGSFFRSNASVGPVLAVGGTGLYFNALIHGLRTAGDVEGTRGSLETLFEEKGVGALQQALQVADPRCFDALADTQNPRRLIRALEQVDGEASGDADWKWEGVVPMVVLHMERQALVLRIEQRVDGMLASGLQEEVRVLLEQSPEWSRSALQSIGYKEMRDHLEGTLSFEEARERMVIRTRRLAKRQMTWFRHQGPVEWVEVDVEESVENIAERVEALWLGLGPTSVSV